MPVPDKTPSSDASDQFDGKILFDLLPAIVHRSIEMLDKKLQQIRFITQQILSRQGIRTIMDAIAQHMVDHPVIDAFLTIAFVFCAVPLACCLVTICATLMTLLIGFIVIQGALIWMVGIFLITFVCSAMILAAVVCMLLMIYRLGSNFVRDIIRLDADRSGLSGRSLKSSR